MYSIIAAARASLERASEQDSNPNLYVVIIWLSCELKSRWFTYHNAPLSGLQADLANQRVLLYDAIDYDLIVGPQFPPMCLRQDKELCFAKEAKTRNLLYKSTARAVMTYYLSNIRSKIYVKKCRQLAVLFRVLI